MFDVGIPPPHNSDNTHALVAIATTTPSTMIVYRKRYYRGKLLGNLWID